jgi:hypothetical protein
MIARDPSYTRLYAAVLDASTDLPPSLRDELHQIDDEVGRSGITTEALRRMDDLSVRIAAACPRQRRDVVRASSMPPPP